MSTGGEMERPGAVTAEVKQKHKPLLDKMKVTCFRSCLSHDLQSHKMPIHRLPVTVANIFQSMLFGNKRDDHLSAVEDVGGVELRIGQMNI
jgi:hypothetical protein